MSRSDSGDTAALTEILQQHRYEDLRLVEGQHWFVLCSCGDSIPAPIDKGNDHDAHRSHVAEVLAGYVTTARAQAWDNGVDTAGQYAEQSWVVDDECKPLNPYRTTENTDTASSTIEH